MAQHKLSLALLSLCGSAFLLAGCTTTAQECDPTQDVGFFNKIGCVVSGSYEERVEQKEQTLADLRAETEQLNALIRDIEAQRSSMLNDYDAAQKMLAKTESELQSVRNRLAQKQALSQDLEQKIAAAQQQVDAMQQASPNQVLLEREAERQELETLLQELTTQMEAASTY